MTLRIAARFLVVMYVFVQHPGLVRAQVEVDVNRPKTPFDCDTPIGEKWYGSTQRCLDELCGGQNVYNEWIFDQNKRRRRNPCYGRNPTEFKGD